MPASPTTTDVSSLPQPGAACTCVFVVDAKHARLMPCSPKRAKRLLDSKRAVVARMNPFTIRMTEREGGTIQPMELKLDPGSKKTGAVLTVLGAVRGWYAIAAWEIQPRGQAIRDGLLSRKQYRSSRRSRKTRYRPTRFSNRKRPKGWLAPSLRSLVDNVLALAHKLYAVCPLTSIPVEQVRFDTQLMESPEISGVAYQQGTLSGYEVREYLLEKWQRCCVYCNAKDVPLQIEHLMPRSRGGSDRVSNLALACGMCNQKKGNRLLEDFLKAKPELLRKLRAQAKAPLKDAAAVNSTRKALVAQLQTAFPKLVVSTSTGGRTKFNRTQQGYAKAHWLDAACVGETGDRVDVSQITAVTTVVAKGRGNRQMCKPNKFGFPRTAAKSVKRIYGFQTGDRVRLTQPGGKYQGTHEGSVAIRASGKFDIITTDKIKIKITASHTRFTRLQRFDGYVYSRQKVL